MPCVRVHPLWPAGSMNNCTNAAVLQWALHPAHCAAKSTNGYSAVLLAGLAAADAGCWVQVSLFRVHKHFITPEAHFYRQKYKLGDSAGRKARACVLGFVGDGAV